MGLALIILNPPFGMVAAILTVCIYLINSSPLLDHFSNIIEFNRRGIVFKLFNTGFCSFG
jgi:hypothetical protein